MVDTGPGQSTHYTRSALSEVSDKQKSWSQEVEYPPAIHHDAHEIHHGRTGSQFVDSRPVRPNQSEEGKPQNPPQPKSISAPNLNQIIAGASVDGQARSGSVDPSSISFPLPTSRPLRVAQSDSALRQGNPGPSLDPVANLVQCQSPSAASDPPLPSVSTSARLADSPPPPPSSVVFGDEEPPAYPCANIRRRSYREIIERAANVFDHIGKRAGLHSRHEHMNIGCVDFTHGSHSKLVGVRSVEDFAQLCRRIPTNITHRLLIVEDLSWPMIDCLGTHLKINPEFFEEHLINSGYTGAEYDDLPASSWKTSGIQKSYTSLKWYRPVWRLPTAPYSKQDLDDLLSKNNRLEYATSKPRVVKLFETETNIFRSQWDLWTDPRSTPSKKILCGWEERVSVWSGQVPGSTCRLVVLLFDPLPCLRESFEQETFIMSAREAPLVDCSGENHTDEPYEGDLFEGDPETLDQLPVPIRERRFQRQQNVLLQSVLRSFSKSEQIRKGPPERTLRGIKSIIEQTGSRVRLDAESDSFFQSDVLLQNVKNQIFDTKSTKESFNQLLNRGLEQNHSPGEPGILNPLFQIVRQDMLGILKLLGDVLESVNLGVLDDATMEERLSIWKQLLARAQLELPEINCAIVKLFTFLQAKDIDMTESPGRSTIDSRELEDFSTQIEEMVRRLHATSISLTSNMSLLDSRRSIAEAQSVTKLTELAFFFIPLTFAATLFGMQVEQLETRAPLSTFILIGAGFTALSYLVRLILRSTWLRRLRDLGGSSIKSYADRKRHPVQKGSVPTSLFLQWLFHQFRLSCTRAPSFLLARTRKLFNILLPPLRMILRPFQFIVVGIVCISLTCAIPMTILWTRHMEHNMQVAITVALFALTSLPVFVVQWKIATPEQRAALPQLIKSFRDDAWWFLGFGLWVAVLFSLIIPVAIIWAGPLLPGVKIAVTVGLLSALLPTFIRYCVRAASLSGLRARTNWQTGSSYAETLAST